MEDKNKEVKNWLDDRKEVLPDGFWESVEPHIPTHKKKRRMPFLFWLGLATVAAMLHLAGLPARFVFWPSHSTEQWRVSKESFRSLRQRVLLRFYT